jgi:hypothetical protein
MVGFYAVFSDSHKDVPVSVVALDLLNFKV